MSADDGGGRATPEALATRNADAGSGRTPMRAPPLAQTPALGLRRECRSRSRDGRCGECNHDWDCPTGRFCVYRYGDRQNACLPSNCDSDTDCEDGVCRQLGHASAKRCTVAGTLGAGDACLPAPSEDGVACGPGLYCVLGRCGAPCDVATVCTEGTRCISSRDEGAACLPYCDDHQHPCPKGERCLSMPGGLSLCARLPEANCVDHACPAGRTCIARFGNHAANALCFLVCDLISGQKCPDGYSCGAASGRSVCYPSCAPDGSQACKPGWTCRAVTEDGSTFGCEPPLE